MTKDFDLNLHSAVGTGSMILGKTVKIIAKIEGIEDFKVSSSKQSDRERPAEGSL